MYIFPRVCHAPPLAGFQSKHAIELKSCKQISIKFSSCLMSIKAFVALQF